MRVDGTFKKMEKVKQDDDHQRPKFNLICIGNVKNSKNRLVLSEKAQPDQKWSTTTIRSAPPDLVVSTIEHLTTPLFLSQIVRNQLMVTNAMYKQKT